MRPAMSPAPPEALSFDAAGTLIRLAEPVGTTYARVAARHGIASDPGTLAGAFSRVWRRTPPTHCERSGGEASHIGPDHDRIWWSQLVREVFAEAGTPVPEAAFPAFFDELYRHYEEPGAWLTVEGASEVLARVAADHRCVVLSNFDTRLRRVLADLGLLVHFEAVFLSSEQGYSKPDPRLFQRVSESLDLPPASILHVGDDPELDWSAAERAGFRHFRTGPGQRPLHGLLEELSLA